MISGRGSISSLASLVRQAGASKVLLVTGKASFDHLPQKEDILKILGQVQLRIFNDFATNPKLEDLVKGQEIVSDFTPDMFIGIGGGSVLDMTKMLASLPRDESSILEILKFNRSIPVRASKLVLIPTTAGSGSEATHFAVLYKGIEKHSVASKALLPDELILDPALTDTMSPALTATTALDAFCQALESYWAVGSTSESREFASRSLRAFLSIYSELFTAPHTAVRDQMMTVSYNAGCAINISKTTAPHAISYGITQKFGIPHGQAVAMTIRQFVYHNLGGSLDRVNKAIDPFEYAERRQNLFEIFGVPDLNGILSEVDKILSCTGLPMTLGLSSPTSEEVIKELVSMVNLERLSNNPVSINDEELIAIVSQIK